MNIDMGRRVRELRRKRQVSQEKLAEHLSVSFQAVSKWENGVSLPDISLIPAMADYFGVSADELLGVNPLERERRIREICERAWAVRDQAPGEAEAILREGLERYPGDEILLNNLLYTIRGPERRQEVIQLCRQLAEGAKADDVRFDALRILCETYSAMGEQALARQAAEQIPEIYFTRLEVEAENLEGEAALRSARKQRNLSAHSLVRMLRREAELARAAGDAAAAERVDARVARLLEDVGDLPYAFGEGTLAEWAAQ